MSMERIDIEDLEGVTILRNSVFYFNDALKQYRLCHDLATASDLMHRSAVSKLDDCASSFRKLSQHAAMLAEKVATVWCGTCGMFYRNLGKLSGKDPSKILKTIAGNAGDLSEGFKYLANWSDKLAASFKSQKGVAMPSIQDVFVRAFEEEEYQAAQVEATKKMLLEEAKQKSVAVKEEMRAKKNIWYIPNLKEVTFLSRFNGDRSAVEERELESAKALEERLQAELKEAQAKLKEQTDHRRKAQVLADELVKLMKMLRDVSTMCRGVSEYFKNLAEGFASYSDVKTGEELAAKGLTEENGKAEAEKLLEHRTLLEGYHKTMALVNASYNFTSGSQQKGESTMPDSIRLNVLGISMP